MRQGLRLDEIEPYKSAGLTGFQAMIIMEVAPHLPYYQENYGMSEAQALRWMWNNGHFKEFAEFEGKGGYQKFKEVFYEAKEQLDTFLAEHPELQEKPGKSVEKLR